MRSALVTTPLLLEALSGVVHDWALDVDGLAQQLSQEPVAGSISLVLAPTTGDFFSRINMDRVAEGVTLVVQDVLGVILKDTAQIGIYDINEILFDEADKVVHVVSSVPLTLDIKVSTLAILAIPNSDQTDAQIFSTIVSGEGPM